MGRVVVGLFLAFLIAGLPVSYAGNILDGDKVPLTSGQSGSLWVSVSPDQMVVGSCSGRFIFGGGLPDYRTYVHESFTLTKVGANEYTFCATRTGDYPFQVWDRTGNTTHGRVNVKPADASSTPSVGDQLGRVWRVTEGDPSWTGVWTRRGNSNVFDAIWRHSSGQTASGVLTIGISGNAVTITRGSGQYTGTKNGNTASGTASWYSSGQLWSATIE